jgi:hypothetical protein
LRSPQSANPVEPPRAASGASLLILAPARGRTRANIGALALLCAGLCAGGGCSGQSSFLTRGPTVGQLKTSLSHLEYENEQLKKTTAKLERENRSMEDRLVQEQLENGDVTARLDDARNLLRERGLGDDVRLGSHRGGDGLGASSSERDGAQQSSFPDRSRSPRRKTPFAQISGAGDSVAPIDVGDPAEKEPSTRPRTKSRRSGRVSDDELDRHSYERAPRSWLPVADGSDDSTIQIR